MAFVLPHRQRDSSLEASKTDLRARNSASETQTVGVGKGSAELKTPTPILSPTFVPSLSQKTETCSIHGCRSLTQTRPWARRGSFRSRMVGVGGCGGVLSHHCAVCALSPWLVKRSCCRPVVQLLFSHLALVLCAENRNWGNSCCFDV